MLTLNCGLRDKEIRDLRWGRVFLDEAYLAVGRTKTAGGTGRTIPLNSAVLTAVKEYSEWYLEKFGALNPEASGSCFRSASRNQRTRPEAAPHSKQSGPKSAPMPARRDAGTTTGTR